MVIFAASVIVLSIYHMATHESDMYSFFPQVKRKRGVSLESAGQFCSFVNNDVICGGVTWCHRAKDYLSAVPLFSSLSSHRYLGHNWLRELPDDVFTDLELTVLDLSYNYFSAPPKGLANAQTISDLWVSITFFSPPCPFSSSFSYSPPPPPPSPSFHTQNYYHAWCLLSHYFSPPDDSTTTHFTGLTSVHSMVLTELQVCKFVSEMLSSHDCPLYNHVPFIKQY